MPKDSPTQFMFHAYFKGGSDDLMAGDGSFICLVDGRCFNFMGPIVRAAFPLVVAVYLLIY